MNKVTEVVAARLRKSGAVQEPVAKIYDFRKQYCMYCSLSVP